MAAWSCATARPANTVSAKAIANVVGPSRERIILGSALVLGDEEFAAPVLFAAGFRLVGLDWLVRTVALRVHSRLVDPPPREMLPHGLRTGRGKLHIGLPGTPPIGVPFDADRHGRPRFQHVADLVEQ